MGVWNDVIELLDSEWALVLSISDPSGAPHSAPLFFVRGKGLKMYWLSSARSLHSLATASGADAAVAVFGRAGKWADIRGVQMRGVARPVRKRRSIIEAYRKKFRLGPSLDSVIARSRLYEFEPRWARLVDNRKGFGWRVDLELRQGESQPS